MRGFWVFKMNLTPCAAEKVKEIALNEGIENPTLRISVSGGGCAGLTYNLDFESKEPTEMDEVLQSEGLTLIIDSLSYSYCENVIINYKSNGFEEGFEFSNSDMKSCGCGKSFNL